LPHKSWPSKEARQRGTAGFLRTSESTEDPEDVALIVADIEPAGDGGVRRARA
jgi:hypothetical protein